DRGIQGVQAWPTEYERSRGARLRVSDDPYNTAWRITDLNPKAGADVNVARVVVRQAECIGCRGFVGDLEVMKCQAVSQPEIWCHFKGPHPPAVAIRDIHQVFIRGQTKTGR